MSDYRKFERLPRPGAILSSGGPAGIVSDGSRPFDPAQGRPAGLTYETYYGLREKPFALSSDPRFFYHSQPHASAFEDLLAGIRRRESLSMVSGEIGTGKTMLCRTVVQSLDRQTFSAFVWDPFASREDLLKMVLMDFGVISVDDLTSGRLNGAGRTELSYLLYDFLRKLSPLQAFAVVVIDEAQNLSLPVLEEIRILSDSDGRERQLQVVLVGQPELREKLMMTELRQVEQRITVRCNLEPLTLVGTAGYVNYRLQVADGSPDRLSFGEDAIEALYHVSHGVPRLINRICDRALHHGYLKRAVRIDAAMVRDAVDEIGMTSQLRPAPDVRTEAVAVASAEPAAVPVPEAPDTVGEWLTSLADDTHPAATRTEIVTSPAFPQTFDPELNGVPRTYMQRLARRWLRRLQVAALWVIVIGGTTLAVMSLWSAWLEHAKQPIESPAPPAAPRVSLRPALRSPETPSQALPSALPAAAGVLNNAPVPAGTSSR
jgi:general secretion pathway protein A